MYTLPSGISFKADVGNYIIKRLSYFKINMKRFYKIALL